MAEQTTGPDDRAGSNGLLLIAMAIFTLAVSALIAWILIDNADESTSAHAAAALLRGASSLLG